MRDARKQIVSALITALSEVGVTVYTKVPKDTAYPYIHISEIYQDENGPKNSFFYNYDILIQVVYKDLDSKVSLWNTVNSVLAIVKNDASLSLADDFEVMETTLISNSETEIMTDTGILDIGLIRILIKVEDKN
jgi:hypothetical protein